MIESRVVFASVAFAGLSVLERCVAVFAFAGLSVLERCVAVCALLWNGFVFIYMFKIVFVCHITPI
jgi:hypothetical protein